MITPTQNRVVIEVTPNDTKTDWGLILPENDKRGIEGTVIETASEMVKKGDTILFSEFGPTEMTHNQKKYVVAEEDHLLAIVEKDERVTKG